MLTYNQDSWTMEQEIPAKQVDELNRERLLRAESPDPDDDEDLDDDDDFDDDDLDEFDDEDDVVPDYEEDDDLEDADEDDDMDDDDGRITGRSQDTVSGVTASYDDVDGEDEMPEHDNPNETPEREQADNDKTEYPHQQEVEQKEFPNESSFSEQTDVTPPTPHEFPSEGSHTEANFEARPHGRTTGRMIGHEPGTEGI